MILQAPNFSYCCLFDLAHATFGKSMRSTSIFQSTFISNFYHPTRRALSSDWSIIVIASKRSCGKVMFLHLSVILFTRRIEGLCVAKGEHAWQGDMHGRGTCMAGGHA